MNKIIMITAILLLTGCPSYVVYNDEGCAKRLYQSEWTCGAGYSMGKKFERDWNRGE